MLRNIGQLFPLLFRERIGGIRQIGGKCFRIGGVWAPRQSPGNFALSCQFPVSDCCSQTRQSRPSSPRPRNTRQPLHAHHWSCPPPAGGGHLEVAAPIYISISDRPDKRLMAVTFSTMEGCQLEVTYSLPVPGCLAGCLVQARVVLLSRPGPGKLWLVVVVTFQPWATTPLQRHIHTTQ